MKLVNVLTKANFKTYMNELIADAEKSFNFVPGEGLFKDRLEKLGCIRIWITTQLNTEFSRMGLNARINATRITRETANNTDVWVEIISKMGILTRIKAHNRLSHYLTKADDEFNEMYYNSAGDRTHGHSKGGIKFAINRFSNDVSRILRLGAAFLSENDKAKIKFHLSIDKSFVPAISFTEDETCNDAMMITIRNGYRDNGDMQRISRQIIAALSRMKVVRHHNFVVETPSQHKIEVVFNVPKKESTLPDMQILSPAKVREIVEAPVDVNKAIQTKINELEKEFNELEMKKRNLNEEVSRISSRTIQLKRQMETLKISLGIISEPKAGV
ncbi:hypothetical protein [Enterobacter phage vB-EclM_KMB17]|nr:hypothetical protein [Enterobacter phage vB-EclM_KMB17]